MFFAWALSDKFINLRQFQCQFCCCLFAWAKHIKIIWVFYKKFNCFRLYWISRVDGPFLDFGGATCMILESSIFKLHARAHTHKKIHAHCHLLFKLHAHARARKNSRTISLTAAIGWLISKWEEGRLLCLSHDAIVLIMFLSMPTPNLTTC